jgi:2-succinyl-6-hydroxy-2,4-cyclohexadiene-1-carboxylate synthase
MPVNQIRLADSAGNQIAVLQDFSAGQGAPTLLALHGFTGSGRDFDSLLNAIGRNKVNSLCIDFPGHGNSDSPSDRDAYALTGTVELIDQVRQIAPVPENVYLLAYSMGGRIGLHYLNRFKTKGAFLIGTSPGLDSEKERSERLKIGRKWIRKLSGTSSVEEFCVEWEAQPIILPQTQLPEPLASELASRRRNNDPSGLANALGAWGTGVLPSLWKALPAHPGYNLIVGENDTKFLEIAKSMQSCNAGMQIHTIPDAAHSPHLENPAATADVIKKVLKT